MSLNTAVGTKLFRPSGKDTGVYDLAELLGLAVKESADAIIDLTRQGFPVSDH